MELPAGLRVRDAPTVLAEVAQARDVPAEERSELAAAVLAVALVAQLIVQHVRFYFHLEGRGVRKGAQTRVSGRAVKKGGGGAEHQ